MSQHLYGRESKTHSFTTLNGDTLNFSAVSDKDGNVSVKLLITGEQWGGKDIRHTVTFNMEQWREFLKIFLPTFNLAEAKPMDEEYPKKLQIKRGRYITASQIEGIEQDKSDLTKWWVLYYDDNYINIHRALFTDYQARHISKLLCGEKLDTLAQYLDELAEKD